MDSLGLLLSKIFLLAVDFDGYISVGSAEDGNNMLEIPVDDDGNLPIATLAHSFPEAIGLKFKNQTTGIYRTLAYIFGSISIHFD